MGINYSPKTITDGLVFYLDATNPKSYSGTGTTWYDLSKNGNNATLANVIYINGNLSFNGTTSMASKLSASGIPIGNASRTISGWFNRQGTGTSDQQPIIWMGGNGTSTSFNIGVRSNYSDNITFSSYGSYNVNDFVSGVVATIGTWFHVVATLDGNTMKMYINGELNMTQTLPTLNVNNNVYIGKESGGRALNGLINSVSIYNKALSANEVKQNFNALRGRYEL